MLNSHTPHILGSSDLVYTNKLLCMTREMKTRLQISK